MNCFYDLLLDIKVSPKKYLGTTSVKRLLYFTYGYTQCLREHNSIDENFFIREFWEFVNAKFDESVDRSWGSVIEFHSFSEEDGFHVFYNLLEEYLEMNGFHEKLESFPYMPFPYDTTKDGTRAEITEFYQTLGKIKERPGMYVGTLSVERLYHFLHGYQACAALHGGSHEFAFFLDFQAFVQRTYNVTFPIGWDAIIDFHCGSDEKSFYVFYELLDAYLEEKGMPKLGL